MLPKVVMKFGGTSVGNADALRLSCRHVIREARPSLVVVSAVGGVTDLLLKAAHTACQGQDYTALRNEIQKRHREICQSLHLDLDPIEPFLHDLDRLLGGISLLREITGRIQDCLVSLGERMSTHLFAQALTRLGQPAKAYDAWDLGLITNEEHKRAGVLPDTYKRIRQSLMTVEASFTPVVTGFIGRSTAGEITTLGRGGSDYSAALFGTSASVEEIQIWTDVAGFLRADPRVVQGAKRIKEMFFEEAAELAYFGAKVLHPRTIEPARQAGIPVRVLGTFRIDPDRSEPITQLGTLIHDEAPHEPVRAIAIQQQVQSLQIHSSGMLDAPGFVARVFDIFAHHEISVDVIATSEVSISITFDRSGSNLNKAVSEISEFSEVELFPERSIICLVGTGLRKDSGLLAQVFQVLAEHSIPIHVISQGASRINITIVTDPNHVQQAIKALHARLFL